MNWTAKRLKYTARVDYGLGQPPALSETGIPILRATNVTRGKITSDGLIYAAKADLPLDRAPLLREGEILVVRSGAYTGDSALITNAWAGSAPGYDLRVTPIGAYPAYIAYCLLSKVALDQVDLAKSRAAQPHLNAEDLGNVTILLPSLDKQCKIADFLDAETGRIDGLAAARQRMRDLLLLRRERTVEQVIGLDDRPPMIPLKYVVQSVSVGIVITPANWYVDKGGVPALRGLNVQPGRIDGSNMVEISHEGNRENLKSRLSAGDVVVVRTGQAGTAAVVPAELDGSNCIDLLIIRPGKNTDSSFLTHYLNSFYARDKITEHSVGSIQAHFNVASMKNLDFPNIDLAEQQRRAARLDELIDELGLLNSQLETQLERLTERRQALITAAVTGGIAV